MHRIVLAMSLSFLSLPSNADSTPDDWNVIPLAEKEIKAPCLSYWGDGPSWEPSLSTREQSKKLQAIPGDRTLEIRFRTAAC